MQRCRVMWCVIAAVAFAVGVGLLWQQRLIAHLRSEVGRADDKLEWLQADSAAVPELRREVAALKARRDAIAPAASAPAASEAFVPANEWRNVGRGTPRAALQTFLWARESRDIEAIRQT